jgi:hypothetical protein
MSHSKHSALGDPHLNARYGTFLWGSIIIVYHIMFNLSCMHATPVSSKEAGEDDTLMVNQADQLNEQMGQVSVSTEGETEAAASPSSVSTESAAAQSQEDESQPPMAQTDDSSSSASKKLTPRPKKTFLSSPYASSVRPSCSPKGGSHDYTVAMVGSACVAHSDVIKRMKWTEFVTQRPIHAKVFDKIYQQTLISLIQEVRHMQNLIRVRKLVKDGFRSNEAPFLNDDFLHRYTKEMMAKAYPLPVDQLKKMAGDLYPTLYQMWFARIVTNFCVRVLYGKELQEPMEAAIRSQMKRNEGLNKEVWYRTKDIEVYNHHGQWSVDNNPLRTVRDMLEDGAPFSQLAIQWSDGSRNASGDGSWRALSIFPKAVQSFLTQAVIGDISPIVAVPTPNNPQKFILVLLCDVQQPDNHPRQSLKEKRALAMRALMEIKMARCHKKMNALLQRLYPSRLLSAPKSSSSRAS